MKFSNSLIRSGSVLTLSLLAFAGSISAVRLQASEPKDTQQTFASPADAAQALKTAVEADDQTALRQLFGPDYHALQTGDKVQDAENTKRFAAAIAKHCRTVKDGDDKVTFEVGSNDWPMPIPLVKADGQWHFDTAAGEEEIIDRHIGKDELHAIGVCRVYVRAQRQFARTSQDAGTGKTYAQHFKSTPGKMDGLYWVSAKDEPASPFGPLVAQAQDEGYVVHARGTGPHPFHGYYFRILTRQGAAAPGGKMNYLNGGNLTGGFALLAYPEKWDKSGIMTFIVDRDGKVFQRNLGENTSERAGEIKEYNPDGDWTLVQDEGVLRAASER